jgi:hypothetical protein
VGKVAKIGRSRMDVSLMAFIPCKESRLMTYKQSANCFKVGRQGW